MGRLKGRKNKKIKGQESLPVKTPEKEEKKESVEEVKKEDGKQDTGTASTVAEPAAIASPATI